MQWLVAACAAQLAGGCLAYEYAWSWWSWRMTGPHEERYAARGCSSDLNVSLAAGFAIEIAATLVLLLADLLCRRAFGARNLQIHMIN